MSRFLKWIGLGALAFILVLLGLVILTPKWLPGLAEIKTRTVLEEHGFRDADLSFRNFGFSGIDLELKALSRDGITVENGTIELDYSIDSLRRREVESLIVSDLDLFLDLPQLIESMTAASEPQPLTASESKGKGLDVPLKWFALEDAAVTLQAQEWSKALAAKANFDRGRPSLFFLETQDASDSLVVSGEFDQSSFGGEATFKLDSLNPLTWLELAERLELFETPKALELSTGAFGLEGAFRLNEKSLENWTALGTLALPKVKFEKIAFNSELMSFGGRGAAGELEKVWFGLFGTSLSMNEATLSVSEATLETLNANQIYAKLTGLTFNGDMAEFGLGQSGFDGGSVGVLVKGPWAEMRYPLDWGQISAKLLMPEAPITLFTEQGSVTGDLDMEASISEDLKHLAWRTSLGNAEISHSAATFIADRLSLTIEGAMLDALSASIELNNGQVTWAEGAGTLNQLEGKIAVDSLKPLHLSEPQVMTFTELRQGEVAISDGALTFTYQPGGDGEPNAIKASLGGDFAGGSLFGEVTTVLSESLNAETKLVLEDLELETLADYFPEFDGKIQGRVSGELPLRLEGKRLIIQPGFLEMKPGETGTFKYTRVGWLTQDPNLNPEAYVEGKDLISLMKEPNGAAILTELAMRDLKMTAFRLDVLKPDSGDRRVTIHIEGDGLVKGVTVPVIQDIRIGGDVKETINMVLKLQEKIAF